MQNLKKFGFNGGLFWICKPCAANGGSKQFDKASIIQHIELVHCAKEPVVVLGQNKSDDKQKRGKNENDFCDANFACGDKQMVAPKLMKSSDNLKTHGTFLEVIGYWACETCAEGKGSPEFKTQFEIEEHIRKNHLESSVKERNLISEEITFAENTELPYTSEDLDKDSCADGSKVENSDEDSIDLDKSINNIDELYEDCNSFMLPYYENKSEQENLDTSSNCENYSEKDFKIDENNKKEIEGESSLNISKEIVDENDFEVKINAEIIFACGESDKRYENDSKSHIETMQLVKNLCSCGNCEQCYKNKNQIKSHTEKFHEQPKQSTYSCNVCDLEFYNKNELETHLDEMIQSITEEKWLNCEQCYYKTKDKEFFINHKNLIHETDHLSSFQSFSEEYYDLVIEPKIECLIQNSELTDCNNYEKNFDIFNDIDHDDEWLELNAKEEYFFGHIECNLEENSTLTLQQEIYETFGKDIKFMKYNEKDKNIKSTMSDIDKGNTNSSVMKQEDQDKNNFIKNEKDKNKMKYKYSCEQCKFKLKNKNGMKMHFKTDHKNSPHACDQCDYRSKVKFKLKKHVKIAHIGELRDCNQCDYKFKQIEYIKMHVRQTHQEFLYMCDKCEYKSIDVNNYFTYYEKQEFGKKYKTKKRRKEKREWKRRKKKLDVLGEYVTLLYIYDLPSS